MNEVMRVVLRTFLQILNASTGKRTLIAVAIISVAAIVVLVAVSFRNELTEDELIGALPVLPPASPTELQPASPLGTPPQCRNGNGKFWSIPGTSPFTASAADAQTASAPGAQHTQYPR